MEHTFDGVERTFPKKRSGVGMIGPNSFNQKKKRSMVKTSSRMSASQSRLVMNDDGVTELTKKKKKGSKARQRKRSAKFESKIAAKKAASEAASATTTEGTVSEAGVSDQLKLDPREVDSDDADEKEEGAEESTDSDEPNEGSESIGSSESNSRIINANMRIQQDAGAEDRSENDSSDDSEEESGEEDEEQSEHNEDEEYEDTIGESGDAFRKEIAAMPMGKVKQLKEKLGLKLFNKAFFGEQSSGENDAQGECSTNTNSNVPMPNKARSRTHFVRDNPKRPREMSSKRPVSKYRNVFANEKIGREKFDPRFDERSGPYDEYIYRKNYEFLDGMRQKEEKILAKEIKKTKQTDPESAEKMKEVLRRMKNHDKSIAEKERNKEVIRELRRENNERMRQGKRPIYLTKGELKMRMMEKKFEELKKTHKLDSYIERKSKKHNLKGNAKPF